MGLKQNAILVLKCDMRMRISFEINKIAKEHLFNTNNEDHDNAKVFSD